VQLLVIKCPVVYLKKYPRCPGRTVLGNEVQVRVYYLFLPPGAVDVEAAFSIGQPIYEIEVGRSLESRMILTKKLIVTTS